MSKSVVIDFGNGDLSSGFTRVTAQLWTAGYPHPEQFIGSLPPAPSLIDLYRNWQLIYKNLCSRKQLLSRSAVDEDDDELEIDSAGITNVSQISFEEVCQQLQKGINTLLKSPDFINIELQLRSALNPSEDILVIIETSDRLLRRLPWHRWDFFKTYPQSEMALSVPEYKRAIPNFTKVGKKQVRILAILGNSQGINLETESILFKNLDDAEIAFIINPSRQEFSDRLWDSSGWDILFFAGHSQTEGETGRIYINENKTNNSLTIEQLEEGLKQAIKNGLTLAFFNSCDGLGLALSLEKLNLPTVIVMREPVPNRVAQAFIEYFLDAFAQQRLPLHLAVQQARRKLQALEDEFPAASWLPVICQNPALETPTWLKLGGIPPCPYRGLFAFQEEDSHLFFGRKMFTEDLAAAVKTNPLVAVVGPSGSGKSSVVFAGLIPALRKTIIQLQIISFRPGNNPFKALAAALVPLLEKRDNLNSARGSAIFSCKNYCTLKRKIARYAVRKAVPKTLLQAIYHKKLVQVSDSSNSESNSRCLFERKLEIWLQRDDKALYQIIESFVQHNPGVRLVLIADQFEELYTQTPKAQHQPFLDGLLTAIRLAGGFTVVLTLRADFYEHALSCHSFSDALQGAVHNLGSMSREELQSAIAQPAALMQVKLEDGLINKLIDTAWGHSGRLPLLEFALTQLWSQQLWGWLTNQAYAEIGGVEEALANHAEAVYAQLSEADRMRAQRIFIQLVQPGIGTDVNRRLATRNDVNSANWDLVMHLASNRLVITSRSESTFEETVEIVHESLIISWGRLGSWMQVNAEFRLWQEQIRTAIQTWQNSNLDEGALLRGKPLADAEYWQKKRRDELSEGEKSFIEVSLKVRDRDLFQQKQRRKLTISGLSTGLGLALILAGVAWWQSQNFALCEIKAISAFAETLLTSNQTFDALLESLKASNKLNEMPRSLAFYKFHKKATIQKRIDSLLQEAVYKVTERNRLQSHKAAVMSASFSPQGNTIATASADKIVKLWNLNGREIKTLKGHQALVNSVIFSPDGQTIASASDDKTVKLWSLKGKEIKSLIGHKGAVNSVVFSPDGQTIATGSSDNTVKLWSVKGKEIKSLIGHKAAAKSVIFSPDGQTIATASADNTVKLWNRNGKEIRTLSGHKDWVWSVSFSPDGKTIATASKDSTVKLWTLEGKQIETLNGGGYSFTSVSFSPDGETIATASANNKVILWSASGKKLQILTGHKDWVWSVSFSPDGQMLATTSKDRTVKLWQLKGKDLQILSAHEGAINRAIFSPDGQMLATASQDKTVKFWSIAGKKLQDLKGFNSGLTDISFSRKGNKFATATNGGNVTIWQRNSEKIKTFNNPSDWIWNVSFSPDDRTIATTSTTEKAVKVWSIDGNLKAVLKGHTDGVNGVSFSPDGQRIATASWDQTVRLWSKEGQEIATLKGHSDGVHSVVFSHDGQNIASTSEDKTAKLWTREGKEIATLRGHKDAVWNVDFSPDDQRIATASWDGSVKVWTRKGKEIAMFKGHEAKVLSVRFSPDGHQLVSSDKAGKLIVWNLDLTPDDWRVRGCEWVRDYLQNNPNVLESDRHVCDGIGQHPQR
jgi:WD40 repeat protein/energy-coupling factor transporter ATP-binding protein EcfA2